MTPEQAAHLRKLTAGFNELRAQFKLLLAADSSPRTIQEEIDALPGRRIFYQLSGRQSFTIAQDGTRNEAISFAVSQDGPFVMTAFPVVTWKPNAPNNATNFGQWSPPYSWPLPAQESATQDRIDLSWEFFDGGAQRAFNNEVSAPLFSGPTHKEKLPVPTLFAPNSNIQFIPTYEDIFFNTLAGIPATGGQLVVTLPGYRIVNL